MSENEEGLGIEKLEVEGCIAGKREGVNDELNKSRNG